MTGRRAAAVAALGFVVATACGRATVAPGQARLDPTGPVRVTRPGHRSELARGPRTLHRGDQVEVLPGGSARMALANRAQLELRAGSRVAVQDAPELLAGDLLVVTPRPVDLQAAGTDLGVTGGAARLSDEGGSLLVATYAGRVDVNSLGQRVAVPALRQATVPAPGLVASDVGPLQYDQDAPDPWDERFLGPGIAFGEELVARSTAFSRDLGPGEGRTPGFYETVLPGLPRSQFVDRFDRSSSRPVGEVLVGAAISVAGTRGSFGDRWDAVFAFRDQGALWGLVAMDQSVNRAPVLADIDRAFALAHPPIAQPPAQVAIGPVAPVGPSGPPVTPLPRPRPGPAPRPTPTTSTTRPPPGPVPPPPPSGTPVDPVVRGVAGALNGLLGPILHVAHVAGPAWLGLLRG